MRAFRWYHARSGDSSLPLLVPIIFLGALAVALIVVGRRGRRIDDHPLCRKCGFDLVGKPADSHTCSECGAELTLPRAVRVGNRVPNRRMTMLGVLLLAPTLGIGSVLAWFGLSTVDWQKQKPVWMLTRETDSPDPKVMDAALAELLDRLIKGKLSADQVDALLDRGLAYQADARRAWTRDWGELIEQTLAVQPPDDPRRWRYVEQGLSFELRVPAQVTAGDGSWARVIATPRLGPAARSYLRATRSFRLAATKEPQSVPLVVLDYSVGVRGIADWSTPINRPALSGLQPGTHVAQLKMEIEFFESAADARAGRVAHRADRELAAQWELLPPTTTGAATRKSD